MGYKTGAEFEEKAESYASDNKKDYIILYYCNTGIKIKNKTMGENFSKLWKDPVWSKIISNLIWVLILSVSAFAYVVYQKINLSISIDESWNEFVKYLNTDKTIKNKHVIYALICGLILLVNRQLVLKIFLFILKAPFGRETIMIKNYNFTNLGQRSTSHLSNVRCWHYFKIKPINETFEWSLIIYFNPDYSILENELEKCKERIIISKRFNEHILSIESFDKHGDIIDDETKTLMEEYINQEIILHFDLTQSAGGISLVIFRLNSEIFKSSIKYGCNYFRIVSGDTNYDFNLAIDHTRYD